MARNGVFEVTFHLAIVVSSDVHASDVAFGRINTEAPKAVIVKANSSCCAFWDVHSQVVPKARRKARLRLIDGKVDPADRMPEIRVSIIACSSASSRTLESPVAKQFAIETAVSRMIDVLDACFNS